MMSRFNVCFTAFMCALLAVAVYAVGQPPQVPPDQVPAERQIKEGDKLQEVRQRKHRAQIEQEHVEFIERCYREAEQQWTETKDAAFLRLLIELEEQRFDSQKSNGPPT